MNQDTIQFYNKTIPHELFKNIIKQLNKDFLLSGIDIELSLDYNPQNLIHFLSKEIEELLFNNSQKLYQFFYVLDISESKIKDLDKLAPSIFLSSLIELILERIFQKVYTKHKLSNC